MSNVEEVWVRERGKFGEKWRKRKRRTREDLMP